jgi:rsbT co-antagonist protein RsbR
LIPINERMLIMPLIGQIDEDRAQQIMETLLNGIAQSGTQIAILDITGVPFVDTQVAAGLIATTQAVRLLGAQVILSGIRPDVAETLVKLDITLAGVITHSNLQTAVVHAMRANAVSAPR